MAINWTDLEGQTTAFTALVSNTDPVSGLVDVTYCGLRVSLSRILTGLPAARTNSVAVFVDTLDLDVATVKANGLIVMARSITVGGLNGKPLLLDLGTAGAGVVQLLIGGVADGAFQIATTQKPGVLVTPPLGTSPLNAQIYQPDGSGNLAPIATNIAANVSDLVSRSWSINSLKAGYTAATGLMDGGATEGSALAQAMLDWCVRCTSSLAAGGAQIPSDYAELYNQSAALLVSLNVQPGAVFVPVLSGTFYSQQMDQLLGVLRDYEARMNTLATQKDLAAAVATLSAGLQGTASDEVAPLQVQLDNIRANVQALYGDIQTLSGNFLLQRQAAHTAYLLLDDAIDLANIKKKLSAELDLAMSVINLGFDAIKMQEGDIDGLKDAVENGVGAITNLVGLIEAAQGGGAGDELSGAATALLEQQQQLMQTVLDGRLLWLQALAGTSGAVLPSNLGSITLDPSTSWDNYLASVRAAINTLKTQIGDSSAAQAAADTYLASLEILAGYGKALGGKCVAYVGQLVQATVVKAQIQAAANVEARWAAVAAKANSDGEKLAALEALIQGRSDAIKRSIYVAWTYYAASYYYLTFTSPPRALRVGMDAAALADALAGVAAWVAGALGNAADGQHVRLPNSQAQIEFDFDIVTSSVAATNSGDTALLQSVSGGGWSLSWVIQLGTSQLEGVLPNNGQCAIWISEAKFFLDGVTANAKGNVIASVATSGAYQNGFGPQAGHLFVTKGLSGDYGYHVSDQKIYSSWAVNTAVYMTPTPYTQWTLTLPADGGDPSTAKKLRMQLTVAYLTPLTQSINAQNPSAKGMSRVA